MSTNKVKQQVRPETKVTSVNGLAKAHTGRARKNTGLVSLYATADLPDAAQLEDGCLAYDTTTSGLKIVISGSWVAAA